MLRRFIEVTAFVTIITFIVVNATVGIIGVLDGRHLFCKKQRSRIDYILPAYKFGCWLGEPINEDK